MCNHFCVNVVAVVDFDPGSSLTRIKFLSIWIVGDYHFVSAFTFLLLEYT